MISSDKVVSLNRTRSTGALRAVSSTPVRSNRVFNDYGEEIFSVGQIVPAGLYRQVDSSRVVTLEATGPLPASFDGRRAEYTRIEQPWNSYSSFKTTL